MQCHIDIYINICDIYDIYDIFMILIFYKYYKYEELECFKSNLMLSCYKFNSWL